MEKLVEAGLTRSIGISNFSVKKIEVLLGVYEAVNTCSTAFSRKTPVTIWPNSGCADPDVCETKDAIPT